MPTTQVRYVGFKVVLVGGAWCIRHEAVGIGGVPDVIGRWSVVHGASGMGLWALVAFQMSLAVGRWCMVHLA